MKSRRTVLLVVAVVLALGVGFAGGYLSFGQEAKPEAPLASGSTTTLALSPETAVPTQTRSARSTPTGNYLDQPVSAEEMFSEFICPCCGKLIGDCTCGMAVERKGFVTGLTAAGANKLEVYLAYADQYGLDTFASETVSSEVKEYKLAHAPEERPQIVLQPHKVDLGDISAAEGIVETSVTLRNSGQKDLVVDSLSTSCGCTTVSVVNGGQEGPVFGAGAPPESWSTTIRPGETAELRVYCDPSVHQDARGPMMREIYVSSNDPVDPVVKASIELNQVD